MDPKTFKDNPRFLILSSVLVPIVISLVGLAGIVLPKLIPTSIVSPSTSESAISKPAANEGVVESSNPVVQKDSYGYLSNTSVINSIHLSVVQLASTRSANDYEIQTLNGEYYLLGYAENIDVNNLKISAQSVANYKVIVAIMFKDISSIKTEEIKDKKNTYTVLTLNVKAIRTDLTLH
ncbi:MAG: hypothetical protein ACMG57_04540 [Candidatus Dojkabacteria bacterium]